MGTFIKCSWFIHPCYLHWQFNPSFRKKASALTQNLDARTQTVSAQSSNERVKPVSERASGCEHDDSTVGWFSSDGETFLADCKRFWSRRLPETLSWCRNYQRQTRTPKVNSLKNVYRHEPVCLCDIADAAACVCGLTTFMKTLMIILKQHTPTHINMIQIVSGTEGIRPSERIGH